jgi:hypothetical protein
MKSTITTRTQRATTEQVNSAVVLYTYTANIPDLLAGCLDKLSLSTRMLG